MSKEKIIELIIQYGGKLLLAIVVWIVGSIVISFVLKMFKKILDKNKTDISLSKFLQSIAKISLKMLLFITVASLLGIKMTAFVAILGAAGLAVGLALQGSLGNFAGGVLILLFKPFKIGDFIEAQGFTGTVKEIQIFNTILNTPDNKRVIIPNGGLSNNSMINYSSESTRRVDFNFGVGYESDIAAVKEILMNIVSNNEMVLKNPAPFVRLGELADSSINFIVRVWVKPENYWDVHFDTIERVKLSFDKNNINIPYPHIDVNLTK
ncbi:MAG: mechanosensitive ion channel [Candidatus Cloacimonetes bacterium]|nr:mechanosensitive ion channel [Candidatus Cloacimonadota bacterium]